LVGVLARKRLGGEEHFVIRQPDGTLTLLPAWMATPVAASFRLISDPRLPVNRLLEVRILVEALLASSLRESSRSGGGGHDRRITSSARPVREPFNSHRRSQLLKELLTEALAESAAEADDDRGEDGGEQDRA
jgi:hypothetical protein